MLMCHRLAFNKWPPIMASCCKECMSVLKEVFGEREVTPHFSTSMMAQMIFKTVYHLVYHFWRQCHQDGPGSSSRNIAHAITNGEGVASIPHLCEFWLVVLGSSLSAQLNWAPEMISRLTIACLSSVLLSLTNGTFVVESSGENENLNAQKKRKCTQKQCELRFFGSSFHLSFRQCLFVFGNDETDTVIVAVLLPPTEFPCGIVSYCREAAWHSRKESGKSHFKVAFLVLFYLDIILTHYF